MKRILFLLILGLSGTLAAIEGQVLATLARNLEDQWKELLPERENDEAASKFKLGNLLRFGKGKKQDGNENS